MVGFLVAGDAEDFSADGADVTVEVFEFHVHGFELGVDDLEPCVDRIEFRIYGFEA